ncbi:hypothetical protein [Cutibacterium sp.]|uniref:hypothetical protein n=1 Tax=Cutibacterium sp. TaxID=1912221 RepID=UPI0026DC47F4|nr:hypothetical protein [Cutibacterium sp.]MDO4412637.1 hypothetical protein [Cutibacterium sp.]
MSPEPGVVGWYRRSIGSLTTWGLTALVIVETFADLRHGLTPPPWLVSSYLIVDVLVILACGPAVWLHRRNVGRAGTWMIAAAFGLMVWALASASVCPLPTLGTAVTREFLVMPALTSMTTFLAGLAVAFGLSSQASVRDVVARLWWPAMALTIASFLQWPRAMKVHESTRLATGMGGSAVLHVPLLLASGVLAVAAIAGLRRIASVVFALAALLAVVLTGSRAGLACAAVFTVGYGIALVVWRHSEPDRFCRHRGLVWGGLVAVALAVVAVVALVPGMRRVLSLSDPLRSQTVHLGLDLWSSDWIHVLVGHGYGRLWPWYLYDSHARREPWRGMITTEWGQTLGSAHSTVLAILVELGLMGLLMLLIVLAVPMVRLVVAFTRGLRSLEYAILLWAVVATMPAFLLDTYLVKNYGVSMWWWVVAFAAVLHGGQRPWSTSRQKAG